MAAAQGHVPLSTNAGSAHTWFPSPEEPPRPDRSYDTLWKMSGFGIGSAFGLTDFYLRSPLTGLLKMVIALIVIFTATGTSAASFSGLIPLLLWGIWEFLHIWTEKKRVVNYGLSAPFDAWHGIGQGMVTDKASVYTQKSNYTLWQIMSFLGFVGGDAFVTSKPILGIRKFFDGVFFLMYVGFFIYFAVRAPGSTTALVLLGILAVTLGVFVVPIYAISVATALTPPNKLFERPKGNTDGSILDVYNFSRLWTWIFGARTTDHVTSAFSISPEGGEYYRDMFEIRHPSQVAGPEEGAGTAEPLTTDSILRSLNVSGIAAAGLRPALDLAINASKLTTVLPLLLGPVIPGIITTLLGLIPMAFTPGGVLQGKHIVEIAYSLKDIESGTKGDAATILKSAPVIGTMLTEILAGAAAASAVAGPVAAGMAGGARKAPKSESESLSTEAIALGATVAALIAGGAIKLAADSLTAK